MRESWHGYADMRYALVEFFREKDPREALKDVLLALGAVNEESCENFKNRETPDGINK